MRIAVLGSGTVGRTLSARLAELGHTVTLGTRDPETTRARPEFEEVPGVSLAPFDDAVDQVDVVVVALGGAVALDVLAAIGPQRLAGTVLVDVTNPLDFSTGFPPTLSVKDELLLHPPVSSA
jgi:hypothetical protein